MKKTTLLLLAFTFQLTAQPSTEVYLANFDAHLGSAVLSEITNVSQNTGYDNQPSFLDSDNLLYAATRNGQTDILIYNLKTRKKKWLSNTPQGSEYSPLKIPSKAAISAIRLDTDGNQLLYSYDLLSGAPEVLVKDLKIGYHLWLKPEMLLATVLTANSMDLVIINTEDSTYRILQKNVGRSLHRIPNSNGISFVSTEKDIAILKSLDLETLKAEALLQLPEGVRDMIWLADGSVLAAQGKTILRSFPEKDGRWELYHDFSEKEINTISRLAISPDQKYFAFVSAESPEGIVNKQLRAYNSGDLDKFISCFTPDVVIKNFMADTLSLGIDKLKSAYAAILPNNGNPKLEVVNRIVFDKWVIDRENAIGEEAHPSRVSIYEVVNEKIRSSTVLGETGSEKGVETVVQQQLDAYNSGDIDAFMATYSEDIKLYNYPAKLLSEGKAVMRDNYGSFFTANPELKCMIKNRIVLGNKVIDQEIISMKNSKFSALAIYEVEGDKIVKVTFLR